MKRLSTAALSSLCCLAALVAPVQSARSDAGILAKETVRLLGGAVVVDSFNSEDPIHSTVGAYDPAKARDNGNIVCNGVDTDAVDVGNAKVFGHVITGPGGGVVVGPLGGIGSQSWLSNNVGIEPGWTSDTATSPFPSIQLPNSGMYLIPMPGTVVLCPPGGPCTTNYYDRILYSGQYVLNAFAGQLVVFGNAELVLPNGLNMGGGDSITIIQDASLTLYVGGTACSLNCNELNSQNPRAKGFIVYCSSTVNSVTLSGANDVEGIIIAPSANVTLSPGGNELLNFSGAIMARSVEFTGKVQFHYDESLHFTTPFQIVLSPLGLSMGSFEVLVNGAPGAWYTLQASTNLINWTSLHADAVPFSFVDTNAASFPRRFYRAIYSP